ncbi:MAG: Ig-like domain-containing protein [Oryzihumus sp.]|jgi:hypothetical protein
MRTIARLAIVGITSAASVLTLAPVAGAAGTATTRVTLVQRPTPAVSTSPVAFSSKVKPWPTSTIRPTGTVCFYDGTATTALACGTLSPSAKGVMVVHLGVKMAPGTHSVVARYSGDARYAANQSKAVVFTVS